MLFVYSFFDYTSFKTHNLILTLSLYALYKTKLKQELGMTNNSNQSIIFKEQLYELMIFGSYACALDQT